MKTAFATPVSLSRRLARVILPVAALVALLTSVAAPVTWFALTCNDLQDSSRAAAGRIAAELTRFVESSNRLWMYNSPKVAAWFSATLAEDEGMFLEIRDEEGRTAYRRDPEVPPYIWDSRSVAVAGGASGTVLVGVSSRRLLATGLGLLAGFTLLGFVFAGILYRLPLRFLVSAEADLMGTLDKLRIAREELKSANEKLERRVEVKREKLKLAGETLERQHEQLQALASRMFAAQEEERLRIAKDLHDTAGQMLTAVRIALENAVRLNEQGVDAPDGVLGDVLEQAVEMVNETTEGIRRSIHVLGTPLLDQGGLKAAVATLMSFFQQADCEIVSDLSGMPDTLRPAVESCAFRVFQEALTNALKHGRPSRVELEARQEERMLLVKVTDNGVGTDVNSDEGFGLAGMRDRVSLLGGSLEVVSEPGQGTQVAALIPLGPGIEDQS